MEDLVIKPPPSTPDIKKNDSEFQATLDKFNITEKLLERLELLGKDNDEVKKPNEEEDDFGIVTE